MLRGLILLYLFSSVLCSGCGERLASLKIITTDLLPIESKFNFDDNYSYIKLQVNTNKFSYLALGYEDVDIDGESISVWYSSDKHVLRIKFGRLHSISSVSPLWFGQEHITKPKNTFLKFGSYQRVRFSNTSVDTEINEIVYVSNFKIPNSFKKFCNLGLRSLWASEIAVDQFGNKLKAYYGFLKSDNKKIQCVYQELDKENIIKWTYI